MDVININRHEVLVVNRFHASTYLRDDHAEERECTKDDRMLRRMMVQLCFDIVPRQYKARNVTICNWSANGSIIYRKA